MLHASRIGVRNNGKTPKKGPLKKLNFMLAFNHARLHDGATTSKNFPARKDI
jgi:hypothetical protein